MLKKLKSALLFKKRRPEKIKIILFILLLSMITAIAGFYFYSKIISVKRVFRDIKVDSEASLVLNSIQHTSTREGVKEWTLKAASAKLLKNGAEALIFEISLVFFLKNGEQAFVTSKQGSIDIKENNIQLSDNVVIKYGQSILTTDQLHYDKKSHIIYSDEPITVTKLDSVIKSNSMKIDLNKNTLELKGNVCAILSQTLNVSQ